MNYYELHIGDYIKDTMHLSLLEHGIYSRLLAIYYTREGALPDDQVGRLIGARSKEEKEALRAVLQEFFTLESGGWRQERCEREIAKFQEKQVGRDDAKESAKVRQRRARDRRSGLFDQLRALGQVPPFKATTAELEALLSRVTNDTSRVTRNGDASTVTSDVTRDADVVTRYDTASPDTRHQSPDTMCGPMQLRSAVPVEH